MIVLNVVALGFVLLHAVTLVNLTPQAMVVRLGAGGCPRCVILAGQYTGLAGGLRVRALAGGRDDQPRRRRSRSSGCCSARAASWPRCLLPVLVLLFGLAFPLGWLAAPDHAHLLAVVSHPLTRLVLLGVSC